MSRGYIEDVKSVHAPEIVTEHELVMWCLISFVLGAAGAVTVLILLGL